MAGDYLLEALGAGWNPAARSMELGSTSLGVLSPLYVLWILEDACSLDGSGLVPDSALELEDLWVCVWRTYVSTCAKLCAPCGFFFFPCEPIRRLRVWREVPVQHLAW